VTFIRDNPTSFTWVPPIVIMSVRMVSGEDDHLCLLGISFVLLLDDSLILYDPNEVQRLFSRHFEFS
jgi:hypothetical protein